MGPVAGRRAGVTMGSEHSRRWHRGGKSTLLRRLIGRHNAVARPEFGGRRKTATGSFTNVRTGHELAVRG